MSQSPSSGCPVERLLSIAHRSDDDWLREAINDYLRGEPLESALDLSGAPGKPTARMHYLRRQRDRHLRAAWRAVAGAIGPWDRTLRLHVEIRRVETLWPTLRHRTAPPAHFSEVRSLVFSALKAGQPLPRIRRLHDICCSTCAVSIAGASGDDGRAADNRGA